MTATVPIVSSVVPEARMAAIAVTTVGAAWLARPVPVALVVVVVAVTAALRRPLLFAITAALVGSALGARAWDQVLAQPVSGVVDERLRLVSDPERVRETVRADLRLPDGRRVQASATGDAASVLAAGLAGESVQVRGRLAPLASGRSAYLRRRHIGARLVVEAAAGRRPGGAMSRFANQLRRTLVDGAETMDPARRALFTGIVLGDDREQAPLEVDDFRASGLTHLLAVSGQNVAFVLVVASPLLRRLGLRSRLGAGAVLLVGFGVLTRWEPSVLRAVAMAGLALLASTCGRPVSTVRVLALAVTGLVLVDPLLAGSIGFLLSAGACAGIAVLGPLLDARRVPAALGVTIAAQAGVAPLLVTTFGGIPLASIPANLLAAPAAGPLMVWGLVAGLPAGLVGGTAAALLHLPTRALLAWVAGVARVAAALPLPEIDSRGLLLAVVGFAAWWAARRHRALVVPFGLSLAVLLATASTASGPREDRGRELTRGVRLWRDGGATVVTLSGSIDEGALLTALRRSAVRRVDILVLRSGGGGGSRLAAAVRHRSRVASIVAPPGHAVAGAITAAAGQRVSAGPLEVVVTSAGPPLEVRVASTRHDRERPAALTRAPRSRAAPLRREHPRSRHGHPQPDARLVLRQGRLLRSRPAAGTGRAPRRRGSRPPRRRRRQGRPRT